MKSNLLPSEKSNLFEFFCFTGDENLFVIPCACCFIVSISLKYNYSTIIKQPVSSAQNL